MTARAVARRYGNLRQIWPIGSLRRPAFGRDAPENTARVVMHKSALPGWFWGMLGCLSVLGVGFGVLIVVARNGLLDGGAVGPAAAAAAAAAPARPRRRRPAGSRPRPQIEQLVPPPPPLR